MKNNLQLFLIPALLLLAGLSFGQNSRVANTTSGDNWGSQNVQTDNSLQGNGTPASPLTTKDIDGDTYYEVDQMSDDDVLRGFSGGSEMFRFYYTVPGFKYNLIFNPAINRFDGGESNILTGGEAGDPNQLIGVQKLRAIIGGYDNTIYANIASGIFNSQHSVISGAMTDHAAITGGSYLNILDGKYNGMYGGKFNNLRGQYSFSTGGRFMDEYINNVGFNFFATTDTANVTGDFNTLSSSSRVFGTGDRNNILSSRNIDFEGENNRIVSCSDLFLRGNYNDIQTFGGTIFSNYSFLRGINLNIEGGNNLYVNSENPTVRPGSNFGFDHGKGNVLDGKIFGKTEGHQAKVYNHHQHVRAAGFFDENGDAQISEYLLKVGTNTTGLMEMRTPSTTSDVYNIGARIEVPDSTAIQFEANILAYSMDGNKTASYQLRGIAINNTGSVFIRGNTKTELHEDDPAWDVLAAPGGNTLRFYGNSNGDDVRFMCKISTVEIKR